MKKYILIVSLGLFAHVTNAQGTYTTIEGNNVVTRNTDSQGRIKDEISTPKEIFDRNGGHVTVENPRPEPTPKPNEPKSQPARKPNDGQQ